MPPDQYIEPNDCMLDDDYRDVRFKHADIIPKHGKNQYGAIKAGACLVLEGARLLAIDNPPQLEPAFNNDEKAGAKSIFKPESEALLLGGKPIGVFYRDTIDDDTTTWALFCLALQNESLFPLQKHDFQFHQDCEMIETIMGIVIAEDAQMKGSYRRIGIARWIDKELFEKLRPQTVTLV